MKPRTVLFWLHLACGVVAGVVIMIMSVTGVLLTYQRQMQAWADTRGYYHTPPNGTTRRLPAHEIVAKVRDARPDLNPTALVVRADPAAPASLAIGQGRSLFVNPYSGEVLGEANGQSMRGFFRVVTEWHRYVAAAGENRPVGRMITGASNLAFLFIVVSGLFLWWPKTWTWVALRNITWFRRGLPGKARDFNWHNTIGFWSVIPLAVVVAGGVVISYPWATALVYRAYGEVPPAPGGGPPQTARSGAEGRTGEHHGSTSHAGMPLEALLVSADTYMAEWKSISIALPPPGAPRVVFTLDAGDGGQPQKRATLTLDSRTGDVIRWEPFSSQSPGRRARTWLRFAHTGEVYGLGGQTLAGVVTAGGAVLVWTGLALAFRRFLAWRRR